MKIIVSVSFLSLLAAGCVGRRGVACPPSWTRDVAEDSTVRVCLPPSFQPRESRFVGAHVWERPGRAPGDSDWVAVVFATDSTEHPTWPPPLASAAGCQTDCYTVDSNVVHTDTIAGFTVRVETGLVTGGFEGATRAPRLVGGWIAPDRIRIMVVGAARVAATLDTLRAVLRTVEIR